MYMYNYWYTDTYNAELKYNLHSPPISTLSRKENLYYIITRVDHYASNYIKITITISMFHV